MNTLGIFSLTLSGGRYASHLMTGSGGRLGIVDLSKPGENKTPQLEIVNNGSPIVMQWDPFCDSTLAVGSDSAEVRDRVELLGLCDRNIARPGALRSVEVSLIRIER